MPSVSDLLHRGKDRTLDVSRFSPKEDQIVNLVLHQVLADLENSKFEVPTVGGIGKGKDVELLSEDTLLVFIIQIPSSTHDQVLIIQ